MRSLMTQGFNTTLWILVDYVAREFDWMMSSTVIQSLEANQKYLNNLSKTPPRSNQKDSSLLSGIQLVLIYIFSSKIYTLIQIFKQVLLQLIINPVKTLLLYYWQGTWGIKISHIFKKLTFWFFENFWLLTAENPVTESNLVVWFRLSYLTDENKYMMT